MNDWQMNLTKTLQKADPYGKITAIAATTTGTNGSNEADNNKHEMSKMMEHATFNCFSLLTNLLLLLPQQIMEQQYR